MGKFLKELFEQYARRLLTTKVRPSISEEGIMTIPNNKRVEKMAVSLYEDFQKAGVPDDILKTENDIKVFHHKIAEINNENMAKQFDTLISESTLFNPKKPADVFDLKGNKIKNTDNIMGGEEIKELDPALYEDRGGNIIPTQFKSETEEQIKKRLMDQNKKSLDSMKKKLDEPDDMATGGRAGYYGGGQAMVGEDLSEIGHGSDALMARNMQIAPGGQATTSTGLNYLLGQDNDTVRVPYKDAGPVVLPKPKPTNDFKSLLKIYNTYKDSMLGVSEDTQKYLAQDFINKLNEKGLSQTQFQTLRMQNHYEESKANGGRTGFGGGGTSGASDKGYQGGGRNKSGSVSGTAPGAAAVGGGSNDRSSPEQNINHFRAMNNYQKPQESTVKNIFNTGSELSYLNNLKNFNIPGLAINYGINKYAPSIMEKFKNLRSEAELEEENMKMAEVTETDLKNFQTNPMNKMLDYDTYKFYNSDSTVTPYEHKGLQDGSITTTGTFKAAEGGPARQGFKMGKRAFLKFLGAGAAGIASLKTGLLGFGKEGGKKVAKEVAKEVATGGPPPHFLKLVAKIKALGNDATPKYGSQPREKVTAYKDYELTEQLDSGQTTIQRFKDSEVDYYDEMLMEETYMSHTPGEMTEGAGGKFIKTADDYTEDTSYMRTSGSQKGDIMETVNSISDDIYEEVGEVVPEAIRKEKADGGRIGYAGGKKVFDVTAKKIKNKLGKNADKTEIPKETLLRDMFNKSNTRLNDKKMMNADELEDFEMEIGDALEGYDFDGTIGDANRILREQKRYTSEMLGEYMSIGGSKRPGGPNDAMADAIENASPGYTGDLKYDANILADDLAENRFGKEFDRLSQKQQMDLYDEAYKALAENKRTFTEMQNLSRPKKTLEGIKKTGVIDISDPDIAEEFTKFMKEKNPKGFTDMEQKIQLESFDPKKTKGNAEGGRIV